MCNVQIDFNYERTAGINGPCSLFERLKGKNRNLCYRFFCRIADPTTIISAPRQRAHDTLMHNHAQSSTINQHQCTLQIVCT